MMGTRAKWGGRWGGARLGLLLLTLGPEWNRPLLRRRLRRKATLASATLRLSNQPRNGDEILAERFLSLFFREKKMLQLFRDCVFW